MAVDIVGRQRLFDPGEIEFAQPVGAADRLVEHEALIGVGHDFEAVSERAAHGGEAMMILGDMRATDLDFRAAKTLRLGGERVFDQSFFGNMQPAALGRIKRAAVLGAAGQNPQRQFGAPGLQIP